MSAASELELERLLERGVANGVFQEVEGGYLRWSKPFLEERERVLERLDDPEEFEEVHEEYVGSVSENPSMVTSGIVADAFAIRELAPDISHREALLLAEAFAQFDREEPIDGVPDGFVPIAAPEIEGFLEEYPTSILYFWREECPPCREMRQRLEGLISSGGIPNSWGTTAVYGPEHATLLREQYQVAIAPTILFTVDGRVDSRLVGENYEQVLLNEIEIITDQVTG